MHVSRSATGDLAAALTGPDALKSLSLAIRGAGVDEVASWLRDQQLGSGWDAEHVLLSIAVLRRLGLAATDEDEATWLENFDRMIVYARTQGWVSDDGASVRVHIESSHD